MTSSYKNTIDQLEDRLARLKDIIRKEVVSQQLTVGISHGRAHVILGRFAPHTWQFGGCLRIVGWYITGWQFDSSINATSIEAYDNRHKGKYRTPTELGIFTGGTIFGNSNESPTAWCIGGTTRTRSQDGDVYTDFTCKSTSRAFSPHLRVRN